MRYGLQKSTASGVSLKIRLLKEGLERVERTGIINFMRYEF